jgi:hypothetical protein
MLMSGLPVGRRADARACAKDAALLLRLVCRELLRSPRASKPPAAKRQCLFPMSLLDGALRYCVLALDEEPRTQKRFAYVD